MTPPYLPIAATARRGALAFALGAAGLIAAGCDEVSGIGTGDFVATIVGDVDTSLAGDAYWSVMQDGSARTFVLILFNGDITDNDREEYHYIAISRSGSEPGVGVYAVDNDEPNPPAFRGQYADLIDADEPTASGPVLGATGGVFTITRLEGGLMTGSFRFDATGLELPDTGTFITATLDGTFDAQFVDPGVLTDLGIPFGLD